MKTMQYYSGDTSTNQSPTQGKWDGNTFTAPDGSQWAVDPDDAFPHPSTDGSGMHYLIHA